KCLREGEEGPPERDRGDEDARPSPQRRHPARMLHGQRSVIALFQRPSTRRPHPLFTTLLLRPLLFT
ncbi:hypothetical protein CDAR_229151, partial [Caerostris darwini]